MIPLSKQPPDIEWVAQFSLLSKLACRWQVEGARNALLGSIPSPIDGCPILRVLCEGWDSQVSPPDLPRKANLFIGRPGCPARTHLRRETQVSKARPGPHTHRSSEAFSLNKLRRMGLDAEHTSCIMACCEQRSHGLSRCHGVSSPT
jgi:hypothetical protein